jgi:glycosyltransferase involved in cell wall biosynthesis
MAALLIIPAYNEAENIESVIVEIRRQHPQLEILVVDDGSTDATADFAERAGAAVLRLPFNLGYGAAIQTGIRYGLEGGYETAVLMDADGQHDPVSLENLLSPVVSGDADLALGSRFLGDSEYRVPVSRRIGISLFSKVASIVSRQKITDPTSGYQAINRRAMAFIASDNYPPDFPDADTIIRLHFAGIRIREVPVRIRQRQRGVSMHNRWSILYYLYKMSLSILVALLQRRSLRKGDAYDPGHESNPGAGQFAGSIDDREAGATKAPG